jgi:hypothetical protein
MSFSPTGIGLNLPYAPQRSSSPAFRDVYNNRSNFQAYQLS